MKEQSMTSEVVEPESESLMYDIVKVSEFGALQFDQLVEAYVDRECMVTAVLNYSSLYGFPDKDVNYFELLSKTSAGVRGWAQAKLVLGEDLGKLA